MIRRLGLVGDVHAEDELLAAALDHLARERVDRVLCVGDIVDGRGDVDRVVELLEGHGALAVAGNHERWIVRDQMRDLPEATDLDGLALETQQYLARLPPTRRLETVAGPLLLCHGLGANDMLTVDEEGYELRRHVDPDARGGVRAERGLGIEPDTRILVVGHTHRRWARTFGRLTVVNAGTLRYTDAPGFGVLDLVENFVQFYDLDEEIAKVAIAERVPFDATMNYG